MDTAARPLAFLRTALLVLVSATIGLLGWHHVGMTRSLLLDPDTYAHTPRDDRVEGGASVARLERRGRAAVLDCAMESGYQWPYCEVSIALAPAPAGIDLSGYDSVRFDLAYSAPGPGPHTLRFFLCNFEPGLSKADDRRTLKVNEVEFDQPASGQIVVPMKLFRVASWWVAENKVPMLNTDMRVDRVSFVQIGTGSTVQTGAHRLEIRAIELQGKWISLPRLLMLLVGAWCSFGVAWLALELLAFRARLATEKARVAQLQSLNLALELETQELAGQARTDPLTGALNREGLRDFLMKQWQGEIPVGPALSLVFADLDHFKRINDVHGHAVGDEVLQRFVLLVQREIRVSDRLVRWGGEEFLVVCPQTTVDGARLLAEKLRASVAGGGWPHGIAVTCSFGVAAHDDGEDFGSLLRRADAALYAAKARGRNQVALSGAQDAELQGETNARIAASLGASSAVKTSPTLNPSGPISEL
ncbi:MAG TPA: GGDEF domain-containing protein [Albitalea sp.]|uniref:GGDEF domain-containing protein n=1 Tax=Piscinibacter sp. TaxID=1903157 RepID=UPI002ED5598B